MLAKGCLIETKGIMIEGKNTSTVVYAFLPETLLTSIKEHQTITTHNTNRHCRVRFYVCVGQPLLKQLYKIRGWDVWCTFFHPCLVSD